jgi:hypothetical protein
MRKVKIIIFVAALIIGLTFAKVFGAALGFNFPKVSIFTCVQGSGITKVETRNIAPFKQIDVSGAVDVEVVGQKDFKIDVQADDNILELVKTEVSGETLKIYVKERISRRSPIKIFVSMPELTGAEISGASKFTGNNIKTETLNLDVSGASKIELNGEAQNINIDASGASKINTENFKVAKAIVDVSGATSVSVNATEEVRAEASGASKVNYVGEPKNVIKDVSGAGKVSQK